MPKIKIDDIKDFMVWAETRNYSGDRIKYLINIRNTATRMRNHKRKMKLNDFHNQSFIKYENYICKDYKAPRSINSYTDLIKVILGPLIAAVDKKLYQHFSKFFVKGTDPRTWPDRLRETFGDMEVGFTDFTSMESHHRDHFAEVVADIFLHMIRDLPFRNCEFRTIHRLMLGDNYVDFNGTGVKAFIHQTLMSGALWTSSANGLLNLLICSYCQLRAKQGRCPTALDLQDFVGLFEGDDGVFQDAPKGKRAEMDDYFNKLGANIKVERLKNGRTTYTDGAFCSQVIDKVSGCVVTDPIKVLTKFYVQPIQYADARQTIDHGLMRARALSYRYLYRDVPIVSEMCYAICEQTRSIQPISVTSGTSWWESQLATFAKLSGDTHYHKRPPNVPIEARLVVERRFGISIAQQIDAEKAIRQGMFPNFLSDDYAHHAKRYVFYGPNAPRRRLFPIHDDLDVKRIDGTVHRSSLGELIELHSDRAQKLDPRSGWHKTRVTEIFESVEHMPIRVLE
jgi:hypothetical protein